MDLTESQKIIVTQFAFAAGCEATLPAVLARIDELTAGYHAGKRMIFTALGEMPKSWRDSVVARIISMEARKG